jgi:replicative DNA helicase
VDSQRFRLGYVGEEERFRLSRALNELAMGGLSIDDTASIGLFEIHAKLRKMKAEAGLDLAVIDYLQLLAIERRAGNRNDDVSELTRGLKLLAKELGVPVLALSQLSRAPETRGDPIPKLSDLRDSGSIEQDADMVWFIYRPEYYKRDREDLKGLAEVIIAKQRNGPIGVAKLAFLKEFTLFTNLYSDMTEEAL